MTLLIANEDQSTVITVGETLTITSSVSSTGYVDRWHGSTNLGRTAITASQTKVFGPYLHPMRFNIVCQTGSINFTSADENSAINDAEFIEFTQDDPLAQSIPLADDLGLFTHPFRFGAAGDGATDDKLALQRCINYAKSVGAEINLYGKTYAVSGPIYLNGTNNPALGIYVHNGRLKAIAGSWPSGEFGSMLHIQAPTDQLPDRRHQFDRVDLDGNNLASNGWYFKNTTRVHVSFCTAMYYTEKGFHFKGSPDGLNDAKFIGCTAMECKSTDEPKASTYSARTATGFYIDNAADLEFIDCVGALNQYNLYITGDFWNGALTGCKFWSGPARTDTNCICVYIGPDVSRFQFNNCRLDDGAVLLYSFDHSFEGCKFIQFNYGQLRLVSTSVGETASKLSLIGNTFSSATPNAVLSTEGAGTWGTAIPEWIGNKVDNATGDPFTIQSKSLITKGLAVNGNDVDLTSGNLKVAGTKVIGAQETGWTASTGTPNKGAHATYAGQTMSAGYVQAEVQALSDALKAADERIKAHEDAMRTHGLIN